MMKNIYLSLGSNLGNRKIYLDKALFCLTQCFKVTTSSSIYESFPIGYLEQDYFLNQVVKMESDKPAGDILALIQGIEHSLDRKRTVKWGPRTIDIDILLYGKELIDKPNLKIPHPEMIYRRFILEPLSEIANELIIPPNDISVFHYLKEMQNQKVYTYSLEGKSNAI